MKEIPRIETKVEIQGIKTSIIQQLLLHEKEIEVLIPIAVENAFKELNIVQLATEQAKKHLEEKIRAFFTYGEGGKIINEAVEIAFKKITKGTNHAPL